MPQHQHSKKLTLRQVILTTGIFSFVAFGAVKVLGLEIPFEIPWLSSGHANSTAEPFNHWNSEGEIPTSCAKCHSTPGFEDYIGADGTQTGVVDNPAPIGTTIECVACHNDVTTVMDSVVFPSGVEVTGIGDESRCMQCHQGRESTVSVNSKIADANVPDDDAVSSKLGFRNIHYAAAGATQYAGVTMGGYQYDGKSYDVKFAHVEGMDTCIDCHDQHSLEVKIDKCITCHEGVTTVEYLKNIRMNGSKPDYDGDGSVTEGIYYEVDGLRNILYSAIRTYAANGGKPIVYDANSYPYFFNDTNNNNKLDDGETGYDAWTVRLVKATYNYQVSIKDTGAFAHNAKYIIQLLYDSIEDLDPTLVTNLTRDDAGHFAGSDGPFRHWDEEGEVSGNCSKCHSATGLPFYLKEGVTASQPTCNGLLCSTCHDAIPEFTRRTVDEVEFPSGAVLDTGDSDNNLCINCHQGRESTISVDVALAGLGPEEGSVRFSNVHHYPAGATLFGTEAMGAFEYVGKVYNGRRVHIESFDTCTECHDTHGLNVQTIFCQGCHAVEDPHEIRWWTDNTDYDGDGNISEGIAGEVDTMHNALETAIINYVKLTYGIDIAYPGSGSYFYIDNNGNGVIDNNETTRYRDLNARLYRAYYNFIYVVNDPGAFAHNPKYIMQILYDSIQDLGGNVSGMTRP